MIAIHTTDVNGFATAVEKFENFIHALQTFELAKQDFRIGRIQIFDLDHPECALIKDHTTLWAAVDFT